MHFSRLPFLPEIDALKEDLSIINDTYKHLQINKKNEQNYVEAYKYAFSRRGNYSSYNYQIIRSLQLRLYISFFFLVKIKYFIKKKSYCLLPISK